MPTYKIYLDDRGKNQHTVNDLEDNFCGNHSRSTPYMCCTTLSLETAKDRVARFEAVGASAHYTTA